MCQPYCDNHLNNAYKIYQIIKILTGNLYNVKCQMYFNQAEKTDTQVDKELLRYCLGVLCVFV